VRAGALLVAVLVLAPTLYADDPCTSTATQQKAQQAQGLVKQKNFQGAEAPARAALAACPTQATAAWALGGSLYGQKRYADTISAMTNILVAKQDLAYPYLWRGQAYYSTKTMDKAVQDFQVFLKLNPNAPEAASVKQILAALQH
jgi:tetratricopeptide (TPR) repeat protein